MEKIYNKLVVILIIAFALYLIISLIKNYYEKEHFYSIVFDTYWKKYKDCDNKQTELGNMTNLDDIKNHFTETGYFEFENELPESNPRKIYFEKYGQCLSKKEFQELKDEKIEGPLSNQGIMPDDWTDYREKAKLPSNISEYKLKQHWNEEGYYNWVNGDFTIKKYNRQVSYQEILEMGDTLLEATQ